MKRFLTYTNKSLRQNFPRTNTGGLLKYCTSSVGEKEFYHEPVLVQQVLDNLDPRPGQSFLDMTFGAGGRTKALLRQEPDINVFCLDRDPVAYRKAQELSEKFPQIVPLHGKFSQVYKLMREHGFHFNCLDGVLIDAGASSLQFDDASAGFSISRDGPLDMRMDRGSFDDVTAEDVVNNLDEGGLYKIIKRYGEDKKARHIARAIVESRYAFGRIQTTSQLAKVIQSVFVEGAFGRDRLHRQAHVATRTFQALRIFVNNELNELHNGISLVNELLKPGGVCVAVSFHSLEDRIIKRHFLNMDIDSRINMSIRDQAHSGHSNMGVEKRWEAVFRGVQEACDGEIMENPRSRSAKLRAARKIDLSADVDP